MSSALHVKLQLSLASGFKVYGVTAPLIRRYLAQDQSHLAHLMTAASITYIRQVETNLLPLVSLAVERMSVASTGLERTA